MRAYALGCLAVCAVIAALTYHTAPAQQTAIDVVPNGGAAGGPALYLPRGDLLNVRNIQGGVTTDPNLDIGAGSTATPGDLALNYDVGRNVLIYDGHKRLVARFGPAGIIFYRRPQVRVMKLR